MSRLPHAEIHMARRIDWLRAADWAPVTGSSDVKPRGALPRPVRGRRKC